MLSLKHINPTLYNKATNGYSISITQLSNPRAITYRVKFVKDKEGTAWPKNLNGLYHKVNRDLFPGSIDSIPVLQGLNPAANEEKNPVVYIHTVAYHIADSTGILFQWGLLVQTDVRLYLIQEYVV